MNSQVIFSYTDYIRVNHSMLGLNARFIVNLLVRAEKWDSKSQLESPLAANNVNLCDFFSIRIQL